MTTVNGLPAHVLLVHFIVVLAPLTAVLAIICAAWPAARRRLVWLVLALAAAAMVMTPLTTDAGEWLEKRVGPSPQLHTHTQLGDTMIYFSAALLIAAIALGFLHVRENRGHSMKPGLHWLLATVVILVSVAAGVQVYRIGDSGAAATWGDQMAEPTG
jgi:ABC-type branched-subunit amino acid transport system permease subunit